MTDAYAQQQMAAAITAADEYLEVHGRIRAALAKDRFTQAVRLTTAPQPGRTASPFETLIGALENAASLERAAFTARMGEAGTWRAFLPVGTVGLTVLAVLAAGAGLWRRLDEYANPEREGSR